MSGIAEVFLNQGYQISGSDLAESEITKHLKELGARVYIGHAPENVNKANVVVISSAVRSTNPEVIEAKKQRIPVIPRAEMLAELMRGKTGIAIAGTHGKTTTTSMLATVLVSAGLDPTIVIGGKVDSLGGNAKLGSGQLVVAEADESDGSFLQLPVMLGVVTNIDNDHLDHYGNISSIEEAFVSFIGKLPFYGLAAVCAEDPGVRRCLSKITKPISTYGLSSEWDYYAQDVVLKGLGSEFRVCKQGSHELGKVVLQVPGTHNVLNSLATIAICMKLGLSFKTIVKGLLQFKGVKRRFEVRWKDESRNICVVDDYGHHPTEIAVTLSAARNYWPGRIVTVFQPHRYSRTLHCRHGFLAAFLKTDVLLITDIYAAGEDAIDGVSAEMLSKELKSMSGTKQEIDHVGDIEEAKKAVLARYRPGDLILCLGAGSITKLPDQLIEAFESKE